MINFQFQVSQAAISSPPSMAEDEQTHTGGVETAEEKGKRTIEEKKRWAHDRKVAEFAPISVDWRPKLESLMTEGLLDAELASAYQFCTGFLPQEFHGSRCLARSSEDLHKCLQAKPNVPVQTGGAEIKIA